MHKTYLSWVQRLFVTNQTKIYFNILGLFRRKKINTNFSTFLMLWMD